jgi:hypothetical protein
MCIIYATVLPLQVPNLSIQELELFTIETKTLELST